MNYTIKTRSYELFKIVFGAMSRRHKDVRWYILNGWHCVCGTPQLEKVKCEMR